MCSKIVHKRWTDEELNILYDGYENLLDAETIHKTLLPQRTKKAIISMASKIDAPNRNVNYSEESIDYIKKNYKGWNLGELENKTGISRANICRLVKSLGINRPDLRKDPSSLKNIKMPDGIWRSKSYQGLTKQDALTRMLEASRKISPEKRKISAIKRLNTLDKSGYRYTNQYSRTKSGKRYDLDGLFLRSSWEANYARYLNYLGHTWRYEPKRFYFDGIKKGTISYMPDFYNETTENWIEIKGWWDKQSKTRIKRFQKYHPDDYAKLVIVGKKEYKEIEKEYSKIIPNWE